VLVGLKMVAIWLLVLFSGAAVSQLLGRASRRRESRS
jgi:hypothetical protein